MAFSESRSCKLLGFYFNKAFYEPPINKCSIYSCFLCENLDFLDGKFLKSHWTLDLEQSYNKVGKKRSGYSRYEKNGLQYFRKRAKQNENSNDGLRIFSFLMQSGKMVLGNLKHLPALVTIWKFKGFRIY